MNKKRAAKKCAAKKCAAKAGKGNKGISARIHERRDAAGLKRSVTALCDSELLGRVIRGGGCVLDLRKYKEFYCGEIVCEEDAAGLAREAENLNVVGANSLAAARRCVAIDEKNVKRIAGVPHVQVYRV
jgi:hypothetical protein